MLAEDKITLTQIQQELLIAPNGLTLNEQQSQAVRDLQQWWEEMSRYCLEDLSLEERVIRVEGVPGSGKSTSIWTFIKWLQIKKPNIKIALCAPTNTARDVLLGMAKKNFIYGVTIRTLYSILGFEGRINDDHGEDEFVPNKARQYDYMKYQVIVLDEYSMVSPKDWEYIKALPSFPLFVCMGDFKQLRPVKANDKSPIYYEITKSCVLTESVRNKGAIGKLVAAIDNSNSFVHPAKYANNQDLVILDRAEWLDRLADELASDNACDRDYVQALCFTNEKVRWLNSVLHDEVWRRKKGYSASRSFFPFMVQRGDIKATTKALGWDKPEVPEYEPEMHLICNAPVGYWDSMKRKKIRVINNGTIVKVVTVSQDTVEGFRCWTMLVEWDEIDEWGDAYRRNYSINIVDESYKQLLDDTLENLRVNALNEPNRKWRSRYWAERAALADNFANMSLTYAMTIHKRQGGTIEKVFLDLEDMLASCKDAGMFKELYYTGSSRAKGQLIICV